MILLFASHNGSGRNLEKMLSALSRVHRPSSGLEICAIDSGSTDGTLEMLRAAAHWLPMMIISVTEPGKNRAINAGLDAVGPRLSAHDLVAMTDDDVIPSVDWLVELERAAEDAPDADLFTGPIDPIFPSPPSSDLMRLSDKFDVLFAQSAGASGSCSARRVFGPNMAVRASVFAAGVRFNEQIGPDGTARYAMGGETELAQRLERGGARTRYVPRARVGHLIQPEQMSPSSAYMRAFRHGAGVARLQSLGRRCIFGVPIGLLERSVSAATRGLLGRVGVPGICPIRARYDQAWFRGAINAHLERARLL